MTGDATDIVLGSEDGVGDWQVLGVSSASAGGACRPVHDDSKAKGANAMNCCTGTISGTSSGTGTGVQRLEGCRCGLDTIRDASTVIGVTNNGAKVWLGTGFGSAGKTRSRGALDAGNDVMLSVGGCSASTTFCWYCVA